MSMISITGKVLNIFEKPATKRGDEEISAKSQVQLLGNIPLTNGSTKLDLVTLTTDNPKSFEQFKGKEVTVPIGVFSPQKGSIIYFIPKGSSPLPA
jgi:hypothetical protein